MAESGAAREAKRKAKKKQAGFVRIELWIKSEWKKSLLEFVNKLKGKE